MEAQDGRNDGEAMSKAVFDKIASGLDEALSVAKGQAMTPIKAAVKAAHERGFGGHEEEGLLIMPFDERDARAIITAFLDAAAARQGVCWMVAEAFVEAERPFADTGGIILDDAGKAAILALKEAVNG